MHRPQEQVRKFHQVLNQPTSPANPELRFGELRAKLLLEEVMETAAGFVGEARMRELVAEQLENANRAQAPDLCEAIDGCIDVLVVAYGALEVIGVDAEPFFDEVMRANMAKAGGPIREDGKRLKPEGWQPPDIKGVLVSEADLEEKARQLARAALRPATLAAEFQVDTKEVVDAIAAALFPFLKRFLKRER